MIKDLSVDTSQLNKYIYHTGYASKNVDTLLQLLSDSDLKNISTGKLYWYGLWGGVHDYFVPNDATFQQMKSSGALRYFNNHDILNQVTQYDQLCRKWQTTEETNRDLYIEVRKTRAQIFEFKYNKIANDIYQNNRSTTGNEKKLDSLFHANPPLLSYDKTLMNEYVELVRSRFIPYDVMAADSLLNKATYLISDLKKEYKLKDE